MSSDLIPEGKQTAECLLSILSAFNVYLIITFKNVDMKGMNREMIKK